MMKEITTNDLKESLILLLPQRIADGEGGWRESWRNGPRVWANLWPLMGGSGFQAEDQGGPMASHLGYLKSLPPAHYRIVIRAGVTLPPKVAFIWQLRRKAIRLLVTTTPVLIQSNKFLSMIAVEEIHA